MQQQISSIWETKKDAELKMPFYPYMMIIHEFSILYSSVLLIKKIIITKTIRYLGKLYRKQEEYNVTK